MSFSPFFEPENMSDDELSSKLIELRRKLMMASYSQSSFQLIQTLQDMCLAIEEVQQGRFQLQAAEAWSKMFPDVIESDPGSKERIPDPKLAGKMVTKKRMATSEIFHKEYLNQPPKKKPDTN